MLRELKNGGISRLTLFCKYIRRAWVKSFQGKFSPRLTEIVLAQDWDE